jgi:oxygen-independent coproporphyrinogen-3 oxidase
MLSRQRWGESLEAALELEPEHLSCYLLTVDERVPMGRDIIEGRLTATDDEAAEDQYKDTMETLERAGYEHYEISNWARPNRASRHNLTYWLDQPYLAFGSGAAGSLHGRRWKHHPSPDRYMEAVVNDDPPCIEDEVVDENTRMADFISLQLRLRRGLDRAEFVRRFDRSVEDVLGDELRALLHEGVLEMDSDYARVTRDWVFVTNEVLARLLSRLE